MAATGSAKKASAQRATATKTATKKTATQPAAKRTSAAKKAPATKPAAPKAAAPGRRRVAPSIVGPDEKPWTAKELAALRAEIEGDITQLEEEIRRAEAELLEMMQDAGDGAGDDQADAGAKTFEREQEISLANNARDLLEQNRRALGRMDDGSYGTCEHCGNAIGKLRLQAAPRATLCMPCKRKEERR